MTDWLPGAVPPPEGSPDEGVPWHYGDPHAEQRALEAGVAIVDLSHRGVITITGEDRLTWLHDLTSAWVRDLAPGASRYALLLDPHGHVEHELHLTDDGSTTWITVEPGGASAVLDYLQRMRFMLRVEPVLRDDLAVVWRSGDAVPDGALAVIEAPGEFTGAGITASGEDRGGSADKYVPRRPGSMPGREAIVARDDLARVMSGATPAGTWAWDAMRIAAGVPRIGLDEDERSLPHELGLIGPAVHLSKGCYRGQEAVARVHNLGRPPRRLVLLHLDGSTHDLPAPGDEVFAGERAVGSVRSAARHFELGPIALALVKSNVDDDAPLVVQHGETPISASVEPIVVSLRPQRP